MTTATDALRPRRRSTVSVDVGGVLVGSAHPIVVQSMTNTDTADPDATAIQVARLAHAGSQLVRVTVNTDEAAAAVPEMMRKLRGLGVDVPVKVDDPQVAAAQMRCDAAGRREADRVVAAEHNRECAGGVDV